MFPFQISDQTEFRPDRQGGQVINLDLPNAHFLPYMDIKGVCHAHILSKNKNILQAMESHLQQK